MRYFIDTEFYEDGTNIFPISIAIVAQDGRALYAELPFDPAIVPAGHFVREHVLPNTYMHGRKRLEFNPADIAIFNHPAHQVVETLLDFIGNDKAPEFYAYFCAYDWVLLCQLFGTMVQLPAHFPKWCVDLKQMAWERGRDHAWINEHVPDPAGEHNALVDARWCKQLYDKLTQGTKPRFLPAPGDAFSMYTAHDIPFEGITVMASALQVFLATPVGPLENETTQFYRIIGQHMLDAMYAAVRPKNPNATRIESMATEQLDKEREAMLAATRPQVVVGHIGHCLPLLAPITNTHRTDEHRTER